MRIGSRLFPYPVLQNNSDDYLTASFGAKMDITLDGPGSFRLLCTAELCSEDLIRLIDDGKAAFAFHLECVRTAKRMCHIGPESFYRTTLPTTSLNGRVELTGFVVATEAVEDFVGTDWNPDYKGLSFSLPAGSILAYSELDPVGVQHPAPGERGGGIFMVCSNPEITNGIAAVSPENNRIVIALGTAEFREYEQYAKSPQFIPMLRALLLLPALTYIFSELKTEEGWEEWEDSAWLRVLQEQYAKQGINLHDEIYESNKNAVVLAQECLASPVREALARFSLIDQDTAEDDGT